MMRTINVDYYHSEGSNQTQVDIQDGAFEDMVNEMLSLVYQIADESGERNVEIYNVEEVPYDGEEE